MSLNLLNILPFDRFDCFDSGRPKIQSIPGNDGRLASIKIKAIRDSLIRAFIYMGWVGLDKLLGSMATENIEEIPMSNIGLLPGKVLRPSTL